MLVDAEPFNCVCIDFIGISCSSSCSGSFSDVYLVASYDIDTTLFVVFTASLLRPLSQRLRLLQQTSYIVFLILLIYQRFNAKLCLCLLSQNPCCCLDFVRIPSHSRAFPSNCATIYSDKSFHWICLTQKECSAFKISVNEES